MEEHEKPNARDSTVSGARESGLAEAHEAGPRPAAAASSSSVPAAREDEAVKPGTRRAVWRGLIESDQLQRYYGGLAGKLLRRSRYGVWVAAALAAAGAICFAFGSAVLSDSRAGDILNLFGALLAALAAFVNVWVGASASGNRAITEAFREDRLGAIRGEWLALWEKIESGEPIGNREVLDECRRLSREEQAITRGARREVDDTLWESSQTAAHEYWRPRPTLPEL